MRFGFFRSTFVMNRGLILGLAVGNSRFRRATEIPFITRDNRRVQTGMAVCRAARADVPPQGAQRGFRGLSVVRCGAYRLR